MRALHIINEPSGPGGLFLAPLRLHGFRIDAVDVAQHELPKTPRGLRRRDLVRRHREHARERHLPMDRRGDRAAARGARRRRPGDRPVPGRPAAHAGGRRRRCTAATPPRSAGSRCTRTRRPPPTPCSRTCRRRSWRCSGTTTPASFRPAAVELARNSTCLQAFRLGEAAWGTQFHIEVTRDILLNWMRWGKPELEKAGYTEERYLAELDAPPRAAHRHRPGHGRALRPIAAERARSAA